MTDYFTLLDQPRLPWLEVESLERRFLARSAAEHPDRFHGVPEEERREATRRYAELNAAFQCLKDPKCRALHLLRLESGRDPAEVQEIPHETTELFMAVAQLGRQLDHFLRAKAAQVSPILKARHFQQGQVLVEKVQALQSRLTEWRASLEKQLAELNDAWMTAPALGHPERIAALPLARLEQIYRLLSYRDRWHQQLQERLFQYSL